MVKSKIIIILYCGYLVPVQFIGKIFLSSLNCFGTFDKINWLLYVFSFWNLHCSIILYIYPFANITKIFFSDLDFLLFFWDSDHMKLDLLFF